LLSIVIDPPPLPDSAIRFIELANYIICPISIGRKSPAFWVKLDRKGIPLVNDIKIP
jgi:hypothetical protein